MADEIPGKVDLFGNPWVEAKDARGRKRHKRTPEIAEKVALLRAGGTSVEDIALYVGLSEPTLRKYYFRELGNGVALIKAVLLQTAWEEAKAGKVSAIRYCDEAFTKGTVDRISRSEPTVKEPVKGKKELRQEAAEAAATMGGRLATPEPPRLN